MRSFFVKPKPFFTTQEQGEITKAIQQSEQRTSGEIRLFIESRCRYVDPIERAAEVFFNLKMNETAERNAVLIYMAFKDHQLAIFGDEGIYQKTGPDFWKTEVSHMLRHFNRNNFKDGFVTVINEIGEALYRHFPYNSNTDKNELPDDIVFGK
ncbi:MAG: TPM domain-containing protein [Chitinophagaceae bacterium]|nr:TPM domain-containing protein [Chitinophagaceae bacterium]